MTQIQEDTDKIIDELTIEINRRALVLEYAAMDVVKVAGIMLAATVLISIFH